MESAPKIIENAAELKTRIPGQLHISKPDYVVFVPEVDGETANDTGNEHLLVFDGPDGSLMAIWTQSSVECTSPDLPADQHIAFSRSNDEGLTWSKSRIIAGPRKVGDGYMASWGYPLVSKSGRIYVLYSQHIGKFDTFFHHTGWLHGIFSDDNGQTWSKPENITVARSINDNPDSSMPPNMLCWQKPLRLGRDNKYFAGFTRWTSLDVRQIAKPDGHYDSRSEFMRFENIDENPSPANIKICWFASNENALCVPTPSHPDISICQEPSIVKLPDGRLFAVMRTVCGSPFWSQSHDGGENWTKTRPLLNHDGGTPLPHPLSPCPIYDLGGNTAGSGEYVLFIHNNTNPTRRPMHIVHGHFHPEAEQPVSFDDPKLFMDHDGVRLGLPGTIGRADISFYSSFTVRNSTPVLWYPERKFFLLGRKIKNEQFNPSH